MRDQFTGSATRKRKHRVQTSQESGWSRSDGETPPKRTRTLEPPQGTRPRRAEHVRIAPVFLYAALRRKREGIRVGEKRNPAAFSSRSDDVTGQQTSPLPHLFEEGAWTRQQLSPSVLNICLEDIQASNPAFPVRPVFSTLQKRAGLQQSPSAGQVRYLPEPRVTPSIPLFKLPSLSFFTAEVSPGETASERQRMEGCCEPDVEGGLAVKRRKLSRPRRLKQQRGCSAEPLAAHMAPTTGEQSGGGFPLLVPPRWVPPSALAQDLVSRTFSGQTSTVLSVHVKSLVTRRQ